MVKTQNIIVANIFGFTMYMYYKLLNIFIAFVIVSNILHNYFVTEKRQLLQRKRSLLSPGIHDDDMF